MRTLALDNPHAAISNVKADQLPSCELTRRAILCSHVLPGHKRSLSRALFQSLSQADQWDEEAATHLPNVKMVGVRARAGLEQLPRFVQFSLIPLQKRPCLHEHHYIILLYHPCHIDCL